MSSMLKLFVIFPLFFSTDATINNINSQRPEQRQAASGSNLVDPYYAFNPDYMGGNMPNIPIVNTDMNFGLFSTCRCACADLSFAPPISCNHPQLCVAYCLRMYPAQCTLINTYGCCGSSCQYFQSQSLENRHCSCNCGGQQFFNPIDTCNSPQSCFTQCLANFPQACVPIVTQACCGQDCRSYAQSVADSCACRCKGNTYFPAPKCMNAESCVSTCMTTYGDCTVGETQGCCGAACATYVPTCSCNCGSEFSTLTSVPCRSSQICLGTCLSSYGACTQDNTQACCGNDCLNAFPSCTCMCGTNQYVTLPMTCGSANQCVQACIQSVPQCNIVNARGCCGGECTSFIPSCRCQCGINIYYTTSHCMTAEQCTNACIGQFGFACTPTNTIGCCNGPYCTKRNRFLGVSQASTCSFSYSIMLLSISSCLLAI